MMRHIPGYFLKRRFNRVVLVLSILFVCWYGFPSYSLHTNVNKNHSSIEVYKFAQRLIIKGVLDPPCSWIDSKKPIYLCSGHCPWVQQENIKCTFLPRIVHPEFVKFGMYCTPPDDDCLHYNAWLKDSLPLTRELIREIPSHLVNNFTLNGLIPIKYAKEPSFANYSGPGLTWTAEFIQEYRDKVKARQPFGSYTTDALYPVLDIYRNLAVVEKKCAVIGTEFPWIEAALLEHNALSVTTIEYNKISVVNVPRLFSTTPDVFASKQRRDAAEGRLTFFDSVWSYSSLEHDGLGRYTDPINPYGDLQTMIKISCMLKPGGFLFLAVPIHRYDEVHFNLHRIYGPIRYPIMYRYFHLVHVFADRIPDGPNEMFSQPILVLQNKVGCSS